MKTIKNKIQQLAISFAAIVAVTGLTSCEKQPNGVDENAGLIIKLQAPPMISVEEETRGATISGIFITDVWVFQYAADGTLMNIQFRGEDDINQNDGKLYLAQVVTDGFKNEDSRFYIIANGGSSLFSESGSYTEADIKSKTVSAGSDMTSELSFLTAGPIEFKQQEVDNGKAVLVAPLERTYAKISLLYTVRTGTGSFTATGATISNIPKSMAVSTRGGGDLSTPYPTTSNINTGTVTIDGTSSGWQPNRAKDFYIPENLRGIGKSTTFAGKNLAVNGPNSSLTGCTYVTIKGTYKYNSAHTGGIDVEYRFYLGGNLMNDYNIQRGTAYTIAVNIAGANSADIRVTITNGNVVVFDQVQEVTSTVDFL